MKKIIFAILFVLLIIVAVCGWLLLGPATKFSTKSEALYIRTNAATKEAVLDSLQKNKIIGSPTIFSLLADRLHYWDNIKPGKYVIERGSSLLSIVRKLRNGQQTPVKLVITKLRTKEDLARLVGRHFECDSLSMIAFLNSVDSLQAYNADTATAMWNVLPDTYTFIWNTTPKKIYQRLSAETKKFWTTDRKSKAEALQLNPTQAYTLASIIEEETNNLEEKDTMASVYLNRIAVHMPLQADPTVKFALRDFSIKRIMQKHWEVPSPYNTYLVKGLPPGPICTPSKETIDAVLSAPKTPYLYFVANKNLKQSHIFTTNYADHLKYAKAYQQVLDSLALVRKEKEGS